MKRTNIGIELDLARNMFGRLAPDIRERLQAVVDNPTEKTWDNAHSIIVGAYGWTTLWQAVIAVDPSFPRSGPRVDQKGRVLEGWVRIPDRRTLLSAIKYATH